MDAHNAGSWRASRAAAVTAAWAVASALALACMLEVAARTSLWTSVAGPPSYGMRARFFDLQLARMQAFARAGGVDCVFFGNSAALHGLDPEVFAEAYAAQTGWRPRCFNFGIPGETASDVRALAPVLARDYPLRLLVYAVTPRDIRWGALGPNLSASPWLRYRSGGFNLAGALTENSAAFRYFLLFRRWLAPGPPEPFVAFRSVREDGFYPTSRTLPADEFLTGGAYASVSRPGKFDAGPLQALTGLAERGAKVVVAEMPASPAAVRAHTLPADMRRESDAYGVFRTALAEKTADGRATFVAAPADDVLPADGWADFVHMNARGAAAYSRWLAQRCGAPPAQAAGAVLPGGS